jgi:hypothetical protein
MRAVHVIYTGRYCAKDELHRIPSRASVRPSPLHFNIRPVLVAEHPVHVPAELWDSLDSGTGGRPETLARSGAPDQCNNRANGSIALVGVAKCPLASATRLSPCLPCFETQHEALVFGALVT